MNSPESLNQFRKTAVCGGVSIFLFISLTGIQVVRADMPSCEGLFVDAAASGQLQRNISMAMEDTSSQGIAAASRLIESWLRSSHGLKISLTESRESFSFEVDDFLKHVFENSASPDFVLLSAWLESSDPTQQSALFSELNGITGLETPLFDKWRKGEKPKWFDPTTTLFEALRARQKYPHPSLLASFKSSRYHIRSSIDILLQKFSFKDLKKLLRDWDAGRIRLNLDGTIPYDEIEGIPDRGTYELAKRAEDIVRHGHARVLPASVQTIFETLAKAKRLTLERAYLDPYYQRLFNSFRSTPTPVGYGDSDVQLRVWSFISEQRQYELQDLKWVRSGTFGTEITAQSSRSPLFKMYGPDASREIYWHTFSDSKGRNKLDMGRIRIAENRVGGEVASVEILANVARGEAPAGFFFVNIDGDYLPAKRFARKSIDESCVLCHSLLAGSLTMAFKPHFLNKPADFESVGYSDLKVIDQLIKSGAM